MRDPLSASTYQSRISGTASMGLALILDLCTPVLSCISELEFSIQSCLIGLGKPKRPSEPYTVPLLSIV
jgi:hypothetical protein